MRKLKYIHKTYLIIILSLIIYISGSIIFNLTTQQKTLIEELKTDMANFSGTIAHLAIMLHDEQDIENQAGHYSDLPQGFDKEMGFLPVIFNTEGKVIYYIKKEIPSNIYNDVDADGNAYIKSICENVKTQQQGFILINKKDANGEVIEWMMHFYYVPELNWIAATSTNLSTHRSLLYRQIKMVILFSVIFLILTVIISIIVGRTFSLQLKDLTIAMNSYSDNNFEARVKIRSKDDIGRLAGSFNKMATKLNNLYSKLKEKVEERTYALQQGNEELQLQNEEIEQQNEEIRAINDEMQALNSELVKSEMKTRRMIENLEDEYIFYSQRLDGKYSYVSPSITKLLGYSEAEVAYGITSFFTDDEKNKTAIKLSTKSKNGEKQAPFEVELKDKHGIIRQFEILEVPVFNDAKEVIKIEGLAHEITERKRAEQVQKILSHISHAAITSESVEALIKIIQDQLGTIIDAKNFYIALYDEETDSLTLPFMADDKDKGIESFPAANTMTGYVIKNQKSALLSSSQQEKLVELGEIEFVGSRSKVWLGAPLKLAEKVIGVLAVQSYTNEKAYDENDQEILEIISSQISQALNRKRAEEKDKEKQDLIDNITNSANDAIVVIDNDGKIIFWNPSAEKTFDYTREEALNQDLHSMVRPPEYAKAQKSAFKNFQKSGKGAAIGKTVELTALKKNGNEFPVELSLSAIKINDKWGAIGTVRDITERKKSELIQKITKNISNAVILSENLEDLIQMIKDELHTLLDTQNFYIALYDDHTDMITFPFFINDKDQIKPQKLGKSLTSYVIRHGESLIADVPKKKKLAEEGKLIYQGSLSKVWVGIPLKLKGKVIGVVSVQSYEDEKAYDEDDVKMLEIISTQISLSIERKRSADELRNSNLQLNIQKEELQTTLDSLQETQSQLIQSEKMAALGQLIAGIAHEINTPLGAINASAGNMSDSLDTAIGNLPTLLSKMNKDDLFLYLKLMRLVDGNAPEQSSKEKRQLKRALTKQLKELNIEEPEKIAEIFIYMKVYENIDQITPLLNSKNALFVLSNARNIISLRKNTKNINMAVNKASKVVFALKKFAHRDYIGEKVESDLIDGIETVLTLYHNQIKQGVEIIRDFGSIPLIKCYPDEINQVWTNLFHNSLQAMDNKGMIKIKVMQENKGVMVHITDTGGGIEKDLHEKIFQPFFTTKKAGEGSGIGLDIVKKIMDKHDGTIDFDSEMGVGTTFKIWLPFETEVHKKQN